MNFSRKFLAILLVGSFFVSCKEDEILEGVSEEFSININDYLISGQGNTTISGSISYMSTNYLKIVNNLLELQNGGFSTGEYLQSLAFTTENTYIITDNKNTITVVDKKTFKKKGTITTGLSMPKFMAISGNYGYVTNYGTWGNDDSFVAVVNLTTNTVVKTIPVAKGPERILVHNGKLYMTHTYSNDIVTVVDINTEAISEIDVEDNPDELLIDTEGKLVVLSEGGTLYNSSWEVIGSTKGAIQKINLSTNNIDSQLDFTPGQHPNLLVIYNNDYYYHLDGKVYKMTNTSTTLPSAAIINETLTGMLVHQNKLIGVNASYEASSSLYVYELTNNTLLYTDKVALGATQVYVVQ